MDWYLRRVLAWRITNTLETEVCVEALEEALGYYGAPEIFNTDQGPNTRARRSRRCSKLSEYESVWMGKGGGSTMSLWNDSGGA